MASCLLAASRFLNNSWKTECISRTNKILLENLNDIYLTAWLTQRESAIVRLHRRRQESQATLEKFIHATILLGHDSGTKPDARWNAHRGELVVSYAENLIHADELELAEKELAAWEPLDPKYEHQYGHLSSRLNISRLYTETL
ncbi:MAG: hypothetical protein MMC33_002486 [Icmadophila ericetorum]|nr:hypothetical protein [Icmadophila ericetorum]